MAIEQSLVAIVDDDPGVRRALARLVRSLGLGAATYESGEALLAALPGGAPGHVLLDLHLPGLRGAELIAALRARGAARVIVMTGLDRPGAREACLGAGAAAYVTKPIPRAELAGLVGAPAR